MVPDLSKISGIGNYEKEIQAEPAGLRLVRAEPAADPDHHDDRLFQAVQP